MLSYYNIIIFLRISMLLHVHVHLNHFKYVHNTSYKQYKLFIIEINIL